MMKLILAISSEAGATMSLVISHLNNDESDQERTTAPDIVQKLKMKKVY